MRDNKNLRDYIRRTAMLLSVLFVTTATAWGQTASKYHVEKIVGSQPQGWLKTMMQRQHDGLTGHPEALSYPYNTCLWAGEISRPDETYGENWWRYEQTAYYTDGLLRLGYELGDDAMVAKAMEGIEYTLAHPNEKGVLGNKTLKGITWPMSVFFRAMQAKYEHDGDERIPAALERHFLNFTVDDLTGGIVGGRNIMSIEGILWTYGKTGNPALLQLAADARGDVFFTDQPNNRIYRWDCESGKITLFTDQSGRSNGMYFDAQGNLIACADMDNQLWSFDMEGHSTILITDHRKSC